MLNLKLYCLSASLCTAAFAAQLAIAQGNVELDRDAQAVNTTPVAYVYVASRPKNSTINLVEAFAAAPNGKLTSVAGSPFRADVTNMAVNGKYLFGTDENGIYIDAYLIESNGSLRYAATTDVSKTAPDCLSTGPIFLDHTGASLYDMEYCTNNTYLSFAIQKSTGKLQSKGSDEEGRWLYLPASFIGNNVYAYSASCDGDMYWEIFGLKRNSSTGALSKIDAGAKMPTPKSGDFYCPSYAAADPTNHVAMVLQAVNGSEFTPDGGAQIVSFTAASNGSLSTTNTRSNMPVLGIGTPYDLKMAPSGKLLAIAGTQGLQVVHFNGASPATPYTGLLTKDTINQMFWDNNNHLYAIGEAAGKLHVFTITPTSHSEAPGSPYAVAGPQSIIVQPWPLPW